MFKSTNGAANWKTLANTGLTNTYVFALAIDPTTSVTLYAGTRAGRVFKSTNGGESWSVINTGLPTYEEAQVNALVINPTAPATLYAGTSSQVYKSTERRRAVEQV